MSDDEKRARALERLREIADEYEEFARKFVRVLRTWADNMIRRLAPFLPALRRLQVAAAKERWRREYRMQRLAASLPSWPVTDGWTLGGLSPP